MDSVTLDKLQFNFIKDVLRGHCACRLGQGLVDKIRPSRSVAEVRRWLDQVREMSRIAEDFGLPPLGGVRDIRQSVHDSERPSGLEPEALAEVQSTLASAAVVRRWLQGLPEDAVFLGRFEERIGDFSEIAEAIDAAIDSRGRVRDNASSKLETLRARIESTRRQVQVAFERILKQPKYQKVLQYPQSTFHNDRVVLPLKSEYRGWIPGIVHRSSDTGATLFVEPSEVVELNNAIAKLRSKEHEEVTRILSALSRRLHHQAVEILQMLDAISLLDLIAAKVKYARKRQAICPELSDRGVLDLHGARHPVLLELYADREQAVVPIDIRLGDDFDLLVITGPNTGGKTVSLKTVGLMAAMTQAGIPIPADEGSVLPIYRQAFIDIGDEQSIEQSLSTFSAHLKNLCHMLRRADKGSLVLIDELGAGTDPEEGAAIGRAIMDELLSLGCSAVVTTHSAQLKAAAYAMDRVDNASVEFDVESLAPTYVLRMGEPGNSNAIAIARRLGMPDKVLKKAEAHIDQQHRALSKAIEGTLESRRQAERARKDAAQARQEAQRSRVAFEQGARQLQEERASYQDWLKWLNALGPGDEVHVSTFGKSGRVVRMQLHKQQALVSIGAIDYEVRLAALSRPPQGDGS